MMAQAENDNFHERCTGESTGIPERQQMKTKLPTVAQAKRCPPWPNRQRPISSSQ